MNSHLCIKWHVCKQETSNNIHDYLFTELHKNSKTPSMGFIIYYQSAFKMQLIIIKLNEIHYDTLNIFTLDVYYAKFLKAFICFVLLFEHISCFLYVL